MRDKTKRKQEWIHIITPEGKNMIASPQHVKKLMGIESELISMNFEQVHRRIRRLEDRLNRFESPFRQEKIIVLLREYGKHNEAWIKYRVINYQGYDLDELIEEGLIVTTKSGTQIMYELANQD